MTIDTIHQLLRDHPRTADGFHPRVREAVAQYAREQRQLGVVWSKLETEVGISSTAMRNWMLALQPIGFHQMMVVDEPEPAPVSTGPLTITSPTGFTLTGCTLEQAALVLRSLQ